jgi:hypothetical protein
MTRQHVSPPSDVSPIPASGQTFAEPFAPPVPESGTFVLGAAEPFAPPVPESGTFVLGAAEPFAPPIPCWSGAALHAARGTSARREKRAFESRESARWVMRSSFPLTVSGG